MSAQVAGDQFAQGRGLGNGALVFLFAMFVLDEIADFAGLLTREGCCDRILQSHQRGSLVDHREPGDRLGDDEMALHHNHGRQETEQAKEGGLVKVED